MAIHSSFFRRCARRFHQASGYPEPEPPVEAAGWRKTAAIPDWLPIASIGSHGQRLVCIACALSIRRTFSTLRLALCKQFAQAVHHILSLARAFFVTAQLHSVFRAAPTRECWMVCDIRNGQSIRFQGRNAQACKVELLAVHVVVECDW